jgi:hypothetical protein
LQQNNSLNSFRIQGNEVKEAGAESLLRAVKINSSLQFLDLPNLPSELSKKITILLTLNQMKDDDPHWQAVKDAVANHGLLEAIWELHHTKSNEEILQQLFASVDVEQGDSLMIQPNISEWSFKNGNIGPLGAAQIAHEIEQSDIVVTVNLSGITNLTIKLF